MQRLDANSLAARLERATFLDLFQRMDHNLLDELWDGGNSRAALHAIVVERSYAPRVRFLAAEILFEKDPGYPHDAEREALATIYAAALRDAPRETANPWGLPAMADGQIAGHVIRLGEVALAPLRPLLDDSTPVVFSGSKDATYGNRYAYRVKDIAASLIARIRNLPYVPNPDPAARDQEIAQLKTTLDSITGS